MLRHYLQWHIIHSCNLHCLHCYQNDEKAVMSFENMETVLDKYTEYITLHQYEGQINLTGGEPLLHPDFFRIAEKIRDRGIRLGILTNGTLIDEACAERLAALLPVFVQVSLDGPEEIHDSIRGEGQFRRALQGIEYLKKRHIRVLVSFTAMKQNYAFFEELVKMCDRHKVDKLWWDRVVTDDETVYLSTEEFYSLSQKAVKLTKKYKFLSNDRALQGLPNDVCGYRCSAGNRLLIILADGDMMACRRLPFIVGNCMEGTFEETLRSHPMMQKLRRPSFPKGCVACKHFEECGGGAKCVTYAQTGELNHKDVNCYL